MISDIEKIIHQYTSFETDVREAIETLCAPYCRDCVNICCKPTFCQETIDSPFLSRLREKFPPKIRYSNKHGWLTEKGCALLTGRPPVCYEFFCRDILTALSDDSRRHDIEALGRLISHIGKNALGSRHLVEIMTSDKLHRVRYSRFERRLAEAEAVFAAILKKWGN